jgi:hypothetical protein
MPSAFSRTCPRPSLRKNVCVTPQRAAVAAQDVRRAFATGQFPAPAILAYIGAPVLQLRPAQYRSSPLSEGERLPALVRARYPDGPCRPCLEANCRFQCNSAPKPTRPLPTHSGRRGLDMLRPLLGGRSRHLNGRYEASPVIDGIGFAGGRGRPTPAGGRRRCPAGLGLTRLGGHPEAFARGVSLCPRPAHPMRRSSGVR